MEKIYILLPVHNRRETTLRFVNCLKTQTYRNFHLLLVDDGSNDGTADIVRVHIPSATVLTGKGDWWWAGSLQQGVNWMKRNPPAPNDIVLFCNDDVAFDQGFLETGVKILRNRPHALLLAQCYSQQSGACLDAGVHVDLRALTFNWRPPPEKINCFSTRGLFVRWEGIVRIGGFHPRILPHYLSDYEFTIRAHRKGLKLYTTPELKLWLDERTTGFHDFREKTVWAYVRRLFSRKSTANPFYWTAFVILACPKQWIPFNVLRIWKNVASGVFRKAFHRGDLN